MSCSVRLSLICLAWAALSAPALAQTNSMFGDRGPATQIGSNGRGSIVGSTTTLGQNVGTFGSSMGTTGGAAGLTGQPLTGSGTLSPAGQVPATGNLGATGTQQGFIGARDNAGRFVGNQLAGQQAIGAAQNLANFANRGQNGNGGNRQGSQQRERPIIRPRQVVAFSYPQPTRVEITSTLQTRFYRWMQQNPTMRGISVGVVADGVVVLRGEVPDEASGRLAAMLTRLEPGVREVRNELIVPPAVEQPDN